MKIHVRRSKLREDFNQSDRSLTPNEGYKNKRRNHVDDQEECKIAIMFRVQSPRIVHIGALKCNKIEQR
jgi:hypothetical protein